MFGHKKVCEVLILNGADTNLPGFAERTSLHVACHEGKNAIAQLLLDSGALVDRGDQWLFTPLHDAAKQGHQNMVAELLTRGSDPEVQNRVGKKPIDVTEVVAVRAVFRAAIPRFKRKQIKATMRAEKETPNQPTISWKYSDDDLNGRIETFQKMAQKAGATGTPGARPVRKQADGKDSPALAKIKLMAGGGGGGAGDGESFVIRNEFVKDAQAELERMATEISRLEGIVSTGVESEMQLRQELAQLYMNQAILDKEKRSLQEQLLQLNGELAKRQNEFDTAESQIVRKQAEVDKVRARLDDLEGKNKVLLRQYEIYKNANTMGRTILDAEAIEHQRQNWANNCLIKGLDFKEAEAGRTVKVVVIVKDETDTIVNEGGHSITIVLEGPVTVHGKTQDQKNGSYECYFKAKVAGEYQATVYFEGFPIRGCPKKIEIFATKTSSSKTSVIDLSAQSRAGIPYEFRVLLFDRYGNSTSDGCSMLDISCDNAAAALDRPRVRDQGGGVAYCDMMFRLAGEVHMVVTIGNKPIAGSPFLVEVLPGLPLPDNCSAKFVRGTTQFRPGDREQLVVQLRDMFGNMCSGGDQPLRGNLDGVSLGSFKDCGHGEYTTEVNFSGSRGVCSLDVTLFGKSIKGCPMALQVEMDADLAQFVKLGIDPKKEVEEFKAKKSRAGEAAEKRQKDARQKALQQGK